MERIIESSIVLTLLFFVALSFFFLDRPTYEGVSSQATFSPPSAVMVQQAKVIQRVR